MEKGSTPPSTVVGNAADRARLKKHIDELSSRIKKREEELGPIQESVKINREEHRRLLKELEAKRHEHIILMEELHRKQREFENLVRDHMPGKPGK